MNHLIIYSHPNPASFNHAIKETVLRVLKDKGQHVRIRDLYAIHFNPVLSADDFETLLQKKTPRDIEIEQEHVKWAEVLTFIYPIWWDRMPAITCGYIDRVLCKGFAYDYGPNGAIALLPGKKVCVINTLGAPLPVAESSGVIKCMEQTIDRDIFKFCGMEVIGHRYFGAVPTVTDEERKQMLVEAEKIAASLAA